MEHANFQGTGNSLCKVPKSEMLRLQNQPIVEPEADLFLWWCCANKVSPVDKVSHCCVEFSSRKTRRRLGTAYHKDCRIILYRHSVWIFLHELAHLMPNGRGHGISFAKNLDQLYHLWLQFKSAQHRGEIPYCKWLDDQK